MREEKSSLYSFNLENKKLSLSMPIDSAARLKLITSKSENLGTTPLRGILPFSFTKSAENILHISRNLANVAYKLCIIELYINSLVTIKILKINNMHNLFSNMF